MPQKTIDLFPNSWQVRIEPGLRTSWVPTVGGADMLAADDSDVAVCTNTLGVAADSHSLDALTFRDAAGLLPTFEVDARNPSLTILARMKSGDGLNAEPFIYVFDSANMGGAESMGPFATVLANAWYERLSAWPRTNDVFAAMHAGRFAVSCIFPSRPAGGAGSSILEWDAVTARLAYTYGPNTTPNPFDFPNKTGAVGTNVLSNVIAITGIDTPQPVTIAGHASAVFSVNGDAFSAVTRNIASGQTLQLRMTAPAVVGQFVDCAVSVESRADAWRVTAGSDTPTGINAPADLVNCIPGWSVPDAAITVGQSFIYHPVGTTAPMPFSFEWGNGVTGVVYSLASATGPWTDGAVPGTLPSGGGNIWVRCNAPPGPASTGFVRFHYSAADLTDDTSITTGAVGFIYKIDLSPVDAFEAAGPSATRHWSPAPSGINHHVSVAATSTANGVVNQSVASYIDGGRWWRRSDTSPVVWPVGAKLKGIDYGGQRTQSYPLAIASVASQYYGRDPTDTNWVALAGSDAVLSANQTIYMNGGASPGVTPTGWTLDALFEAIKNDVFRMGRRATITDSNGHIGTCSVRTHSLRVFFEVTKPPEGMSWEV